ncbi:hypothetical protein SAMN03159453_02641 [Pseudomonas sp. NFIX28]|nr:hypothetical protein [Pseudomonas sp. NFIX28]SDZ19556.1 hypothetical protein SAMN03159453_02641 [Pseudomonas sp. NFIX28]
MVRQALRRIELQLPGVTEVAEGAMAGHDLALARSAGGVVEPWFATDGCMSIRDKALSPFQASAHTFLQAKKNPKILTFVGLSDFKYC